MEKRSFIEVDDDVVCLDDVEIRKLEVAAKAREQLARQEEDYAKMCASHGKVYVKQGSRDKFGQLRENEGGRKAKDPADKVGVAGGDRSNRRRPGDHKRRLERGAREMQRFASLIKAKLNEFGRRSC